MKLNHSALGGTGTNTFHLRDLGTALSVGDANILLAHLEDFYGEVSGLFPDGLNAVFDGVLSGVGANEGNTLEIDPWDVVGTGSSGVIPPANALCVNWVGLTGDRSKRGRSFLGPVAAGAVTALGQPDATLLTACRAAATNLVSDSLTDGNGAFGIYSREEEGVFRDMAESSIRNQFAVLRSRRD